MEKYEETYRIKVYEANQYAQITLEYICNYLQEMAMRHAERLQFGINLMIKQNMTWVLTRLELHMFDYPLMGESVTVETYPSATQRYYAYRDFVIYNEKREVVGFSTTTWLLIDIASMRPAVLSENFEKFVEGVAPKINIESISKLKVPKDEEITEEKDFRVRKSDMDINRHVNNSRFVAWANELIPIDNSKMISSFIIEFRKECCYGDTVISKASLSKEGGSEIYRHAIYKKGEDKALAVAETRLTKSDMRMSPYARA